MLSTWPRTVIVVPRGHLARDGATILSAASLTEPRSVPSMLAWTSNVRLMSECVMLAGPVTRLIWARLPRVWTLLLAVEIGVARSASIESIAYCGVWTATVYWTPRRSIQNDGETSLLDASETSRWFATGRSARPS